MRYHRINNIFKIIILMSLILCCISKYVYPEDYIEISNDLYWDIDSKYNFKEYSGGGYCITRYEVDCQKNEIIDRSKNCFNKDGITEMDQSYNKISGWYHTSGVDGRMNLIFNTVCLSKTLYWEYYELFRSNPAIDRIPYLFGSKYGYVSKGGNVLKKPTYDAAGFFSEGLAKVKIKDKWGFIDGSWKTVINWQYEDVNDFKKGFARVKHEGKWGMINSDGIYVLEPKYDYIWDVGSDGVKVRIGEEQYYETIGKLDDNNKANYNSHKNDGKSRESVCGYVRRKSLSNRKIVSAVIGEVASGEKINVFNSVGDNICVGTISSVYKDEYYIDVSDECFENVEKYYLLGRNPKKEELDIIYNKIKSGVLR